MEPLAGVVTALALGAVAGLKPVAEQAVKDAYAGLKGVITRKYAGVNVGLLEQAPQTESRRAVVKEDLAATGAAQDTEVLQMAKALLDAIQRHAPDAGAAIGVDLEAIKGAALTIEQVTASGTGVRVRQAELSGDITIRGIQAGGGDDSLKGRGQPG